MFDQIQGSRVLVTGASSGIGASVAELFSSFGAVVGLHYNVSEQKAVQISEQLIQKGGEVHLLQGDLSDYSVSTNLVSRFVEKTGGINVLINCAGAIIGFEHFLEVSTEDWNTTLALNLTAPFLISREAFRYMKDHGGGKIIMISSIAAKFGGSDTSVHYGAAKAGLEAVTRSLSRAGAPCQILVNTVRAGVIDTPLHEKIGRRSMKERISKIPLQRAGRPGEVAMVCLFLASEHGDFITGEIYNITGGD